jgi:molecular chaperone HtpG
LKPDENDKQTEEEQNETKDLFEQMKTILGSKVTAVKASKRLRSHPVCLSADGELTIEMEKILKAMPNGQDVKADKVLEINVNHPVFESLKSAHTGDQEKFGLYTNLLYSQALLIEGLPLQDPVDFTNDICKIMV